MPAGQQLPEGRGEGQGKPLYHHHRYNLRHRFELGRTLGTGTYGKVKHAVEKVTSEEVAIKYIKKTKIQDEADLNRIRREIRILSRLNHPNIVNVREVFEKKDRIILVMDCALGGELYEYVATRQTVDLDEARRIFLQIAQAVHYAHQQGVVHRDLKLENIILDHNHNVKVADFGLANFFRKGELLQTFCGSPLYASPEIVNGTPYRGPEVDIWSLGVVLYTLVHGSMPFESADLKMLRHQITSGLYHEPPSHTEADSLIRHMLRVDPAERATLEEVLSHPWVTKHPTPHPSGLSQASPHGACSETSFDEDEALFDIGRCKSPLGGHESSEELPHPREDSYPYPDLPPTCPETDLSPSSEVFSQEETTSFCREDVGVYGEEEDEEVDAIFPEQPESSVSDDASPSPESCADSCEINTGSDVSNSGDETRKVFDSERKPRRGILKRRGKFSGGDSGCILQEDPYPCRPEDWDPTPTLQPQPVPSPFPCDPLPPNSDAANTLGATTPSVLPSQEQPTSFSAGDVSDCSQLGASLPLPPAEVEDASICPSNSAPSVCTCSSKGNSAVIRRRGILKRGSLVDPKKRLSVGSTSSNSSADLLDLSYDSGEGEQFLAMLACEGAGDTPRDLEGVPGPGGYQPRYPMEMYSLEARVEVDSYVPRFPPEQYELHTEREADPRDCQDLLEALLGEGTSEPAARQDSSSPSPTEAAPVSVPYKPRFPPERYNLSDSGPATLPFRYSPGAFSEAMRAGANGANEERDLAGARRRLRELRLFFTRPATQRSGGDIAALNLAGEGQWGRRGSRPEGQERLLDLDDADVVIKALEICSRVR